MDIYFAKWTAPTSLSFPELFLIHLTSHTVIKETKGSKHNVICSLPVLQCSGCISFPFFLSFLSLASPLFYFHLVTLLEWQCSPTLMYVWRSHIIIDIAPYLNYRTLLLLCISIRKMGDVLKLTWHSWDCWKHCLRFKKKCTAKISWILSPVRYCKGHCPS